jgi:hypothetical protein
MREVLSIHLGQGGVQVGNACCKWRGVHPIRWCGWSVLPARCPAHVGAADVASRFHIAACMHSGAMCAVRACGAVTVLRRHVCADEVRLLDTFFRCAVRRCCACRIGVSALLRAVATTPCV